MRERKDKLDNNVAFFPLWKRGRTSIASRGIYSFMSLLSWDYNKSSYDKIPLNPPLQNGEKSILSKRIFALLYVFIFTIFLNSCQDSFGTDPSTVIIPVIPKDTTKHERLNSTDISWTFREVAGPNQIIEWPSSITYFQNSAILDTTDGKVRLWLNLEMKANFYVKSEDNKISTSDRVEYLKIQIDSLDITNQQIFTLDDFNDGRYSKIELYNPEENRRFIFEGNELITRIRFVYNPTSKKITGNFVFDFNLIDFVKTKQFLGNFSILF